MIRPVRHRFASQARAQAERPPLWGSDDVSAMRNYRYRHRDSPYVARRSGERTSRAGRPWAVGGELPGARWRGRPVCAMRSAVQGAAAAQTRACRFFSSTSILGCGAQGAAGRKGGPISSASGYFSSLCWSWGRRTRRRRRGAARARRGERHRPCGAARGHAQGRETDCAAWAMIRAAGQTDCATWATILAAWAMIRAGA